MKRVIAALAAIVADFGVTLAAARLSLSATSLPKIQNDGFGN